MGVEINVQTCQLLIHGGRVFYNGRFRPADVGITHGRIAFVAGSSRTSEIEFQRSIDASGCLVLPGMIDAHVHFNDPGRSHWEGFVTGTRAAAAGGSTTVIDMPLNCSPTTTDLSSLRQKQAWLQQGRAAVDFALWGGLRGNALIDHAEREAMSQDVVGFKAFLCDSGLDSFAPVNEAQLTEVLQWAGASGSLVAFHAEWGPEIERLNNEYRQSPLDPRRAYLASRPVSVEKKAVEVVLEQAAQTEAPVHFVHISSPEVVRLIADARDSGLDVSVETCPHYLTFDEVDFIQHGAVLKCAPPVRPKEAVEGLWQCIADGLIDLIASDHSPCPWHLKDTDSVWDAWGGIQNVQYGWLALFDGARQRGIDLETVIPLASVRPAHRFGLASRKGSLREGMDADLVLLSTGEKTRVSRSQMAFRHHYTPYEGFEFAFRVKKTLVRGETVYDSLNTGRGSTTADERSGQLLTPVSETKGTGLT